MSCQKRFWITVFIVLNVLFILPFKSFSDISIENRSPSLVAEAVEADLQSGSSIQQIPISVPPGINNIQPALSLFYSSDRSSDRLGIGWSLNLSSIVQSTKVGVPQYSSSDEFVLKLSGGRQELVFDNNMGFYRPKVEGSFIKIEKLTDQWVVTDKEGTKYFFGATTDSRLFDPSQPDHVFEWFLNRVEDVHGNYMTMTYQRVGAQVYPFKIEYTGNINKPLAPYALVEFSLENRFKNHQTYEPGFSVVTTKHISKITVKVNNALQWEYRLDYAPSRSTQRDLLVGVTQVGSDGITALPTVNFTYYDNDKGFTLNPSAVIPDGARFSNQVGGLQTYQDLGVRILDVNADAFADLIRDYVAVNGSNQITHQKAAYLNNKNNTWTLDTRFNLPGDCANGLNNCATFIKEINTQNSGKIYVDYGLMTADLDGNGRLDMVNNLTYFNITNSGGSFSSTQDHYEVGYTNIGDGWNGPHQNWGLPSDAIIMLWAQIINNGGDYYKLEQLGNFIADVNKDGFVDIIMSNKTKQINSNITGLEEIIVPLKQVYINTNGRRFGTWTRPDNDFTDFSKGASLVDLNGDGLPDIFYRKNGISKVFMNTGKDWQEDASSAWNNFSNIGDFKDGSTQLVDINGDGLTDLVVAKGGVGNGSNVLINTGDGWAQDNSWVLAEADFRNLGTRFLDADADTLEDIMIHFNGNAPKLYINSGQPADILASVSNGFGGKRIIEYTSSSQFSQTFLPFSLPIVKSITTSNGLGSQYTTKYEYQKGLWVPPSGSTPLVSLPSFSEREFYGFGQVKVTDNELDYSVKEYFQDKLSKRGKLKKERRYNLNNEQLTEDSYFYNVPTIATGIEFPNMFSQISCIYNNMGNSKCSGVRFNYSETSPQLGNLTQLTELGEVDSTGTDLGTDSRQTTFTYSDNIQNGNWLVGIPSAISLRNKEGILVSKVLLNYDNQANGVTPTKGVLTRVEEFSGGASNPAVEYTYDVLGQVKTITDPNNTESGSGKKTVYTYDSTVGIFPVSIKNEIDQTVTACYFGIDGNSLCNFEGYTGLWGQVKSVTDQNNATEKRSYDALGRLKFTVLPLDSIQFPSISYDYNFEVDHSVTTIHQRLQHGTNKTLDVSTYSDGLGRHLFTRKPSRLQGQFIIDGLAEYDSYGRAVKQFLPRFSNQAVNNLVTPAANDPARIMSYDALGRVKEVINPDGTRANSEYDLWTVSSKNENGHRQDSEFDAFGQLIKKTEFTGADGRFAEAYPDTNGYTPYASTQFKYDASGNLTQTIDPNGKITQINYNLLGQKTQMQDPDMGVWNYNSYDANGNLKQMTDARGKSLFFDYDKLNRPMNKQDAGDLSVTYLYDNANNFAAGRLFKINEGNQNSTEFTYDVKGRAKTINKTIGGSIYNMEYHYDAADRVSQIVYPNQFNIFYKYDGGGQVLAAASLQESLPTDEATANPKPNTPILKSVQSGNQKAILEWSQAQDATEYEIKYGTVQGQLTQSTGSVGNVLSKEVGNLTNDQVYFFAVVARNANGSSLLSNEISATPVIALQKPVLSVVSVGDGLVNLSWNPIPGADYYRVKYGADSSSFNFEKNVLNANSTTIFNLSNGSTYYFKLIAYNTYLESPESNVVNAFLEEPYPTTAPQVTITAKTSSSVTLSWNAVNKATEYKIEYGTTSGGPYSENQITTQTTLTVQNLVSATDYYFKVYAKNSYGQNPSSQELAVATLPDAPVGLIATAGNGAVTLNWNTVPRAASYRVNYGTTSGTYNFSLEPTSATQQVIPSLTNGQIYYFIVTAISAGGESLASSPVSATPQAPLQTITLNSKTSKVFANVNQASVNHTVSSTGTSRVMIVSVGFLESGGQPTVTTLKFAGLALTKIDSVDRINGSWNYRQELWYLLNPPTTPSTVNATFNLTVNEATIGVVVLNGVRQQGPEFVAKNNGGNSTASVNISSITPGAWVIDSGTFDGTNLSNVSQNSSQSLLWKVDSGYEIAGASSKALASPTSTSMSWTMSANKNWVLIAAVFAPAVEIVALHDTFDKKPGRYSFVNKIIQFLDDLFIPSAEADVLSTPVDFNSFIVNDPTNQITRTSSCINFNNIETYGKNKSYVYQPIAGQGDFTFEFDTILNATDSIIADTVIWGISNTPNTTYDNWSTVNNFKGAYLAYTASSGPPKLKLQVSTSITESKTSNNLSLGVRYFIRITKMNGILSASIFLDQQHSLLVQTLNVSMSATSFSNLYGFSTNENILGTRKATGDVCRMIYSVTPVQFSVVKQGTGTGTITSTPAGINCGVTCSTNFNSGITVTLTQSPTAGASFVGWSGACTGTGVCQVSINAEKSVTATFNDVTAPSVPSLTATAVSSSQIDLSWTASIDTGGSGLKGYRIYKLSGANYFLLKEVLAPATSTSDVGLDPLTRYSYKIASFDNANKESAKTSVVSATTTVLPKYALSVTKNGTGNGTVSSTSPTGINCGATCSANFDSGTVVTLNQSAGTGSGFTGWSGACTGTGSCQVTIDAAKTVTAAFDDVTAPSVPSLTATAANSTQINLNWNASTDSGGSNLKGYKIYKYNGSTYELLKLVFEPATTTSDAGLNPSTPYSYKITSIDNVDNESVQSAVSTATTMAEFGLTVAKQGTASGTISSNPSGIDCGAACSANFSSGTVVTLTQSAGSNSAFAGWGGSCTGTGACQVTMSAVKSVTATFNQIPDAPELLNVNSGNGYLDVYWSPVSNVDSYEVIYWYRPSPTSTSTKTIGLGNVTNHRLTILINEVEYHVSVKTVKAGIKSVASNEIAATPVDPATLPGTPQVTMTDIQTNRFTVNWNAVTNAVSYKVFYGTTLGGPYENTIDAANNTSAIVPGLSVGTSYYGIVLAYNSAGHSSSSSEFSQRTLSNSAPSKPLLGTPQAQNGRVLLSWSASAGADYYEIRYSTGQNTLTPINTGLETYGTVEGLSNGTAYTFVIAAINSAGTTLSDAVTVTPQPPDDVYVRDVKYNATGQATRMEYGNGVVTEYHYDPLNFRLLRIQTVNAAGQWLQDLRYTYDAAGNVLSVDDHLSSNVEAYSYDALGRVVQAQSPTIGVKIYAYDKNGNVLTKDGRGYAYASDPAHGVDTIDNNSFYDYDANGNLKQSTESGQVRTFLYDTENRLKSVAKNGVLLAGFNYDDSGERTAKTAAGKTRHFVYPFHEKEGASETNYIYLNGQRVASIVNGQLKYIHADHLGSAAVVSSASGATLETARYEPFGDFSGAVPTKSGNYYTGQYFDKETGLYYYGARYYNPRVGQFTTADTIISNPALSQSFNRYSYAQNNPINFTDPTGHQTAYIGYNVLTDAQLDDAYIPNTFGGVHSVLSSNSLNDFSQAIPIDFGEGPVSSFNLTSVDFGPLPSAYNDLESLKQQMIFGGMGIVRSDLPLLYIDSNLTGEQYVMIGSLFIGPEVIAERFLAARIGNGLKEGGKFLFQNVHKATFESKSGSLIYHLNKHGEGRSSIEYVKDALNFYNKNKHLATEILLKDGEKGIKIKNGSTGGIFTKSGKLVSFWD